jgi:hypothetical protein
VSRVGIEPTTRRLRAVTRRQSNAADPGKSGSVFMTNCRPQSIRVAFSGIRCTRFAHVSGRWRQPMISWLSIEENILGRRTKCHAQPRSRELATAPLVMSPAS